MADFRGIYRRMTDDREQSANIEPETAPIARRPGPPKGVPKPPGSGRKPGTPNRVTRDIKQLALKDAPVMLRELKRLALNATDEKTRLGAVNAWLDRAVGKPMAPSEVSGPNGEPLIPAATDTIDTARRMLFVMKQAEAAVKASAPVERPKEPAPPSPPPGAPYSGPTMTTEAEQPYTEEERRAAIQERRFAESIDRACARQQANVVSIDPRRPHRHGR